MSARYFALLTNIGVAKITNATALGIKLNITEMAVGDGGGSLPTPTPDQLALVNERRRAPINRLSIDPLNDAQIIVEQVIPENVGGWWIKEVGLYDEEGDLVAVSNCAETYKPLLQEGSGRTQVVRMVIIVSNTASVTVKIDPAVVLATRGYVDSELGKQANAIRDEFGAPDGFHLIGSINGVNKLKNTSIKDGDRVQLLDVWGWAGVSSPTGTGILRYDANRLKSEHDGFIHFSPTVPFTNLTAYLNGVGETDVAGRGVFVREHYGNEVLLSHCGIQPLTSADIDISTATNACTKLFHMTAKGYSICFDVDLFVVDINVTNINFRTHARFDNKLKLGRNGRILKLHNNIAAGNVILRSPNFDGNGFASVEDGGLLQSNNVKRLEIRNLTLSGFVKASFQANGVATTGLGCHTIIHDPDMSNCGSQLIYTQTSKVTLFNPSLHDSAGHGIAIVNCDDFYCVGGYVTGCDYGILTYSTPDYRGNLRRFHIQGTSLRGNNKAFEISRRYETATVSQGNADVVLSDIDATGCTLASTIGNLATDNADGFALREAYLNNVFIDNHIDSNLVFGIHVIGGRNSGIRVRGKYENIEFRPGKTYGNNTKDNTNCAIYFYASATGKNVLLDSFSYYGINSYIYAESGAVANGPIVVNNPSSDPSSLDFKVNSEFYGYVSFNSGNRLRDMSRQAWSIGYSPFYDTTLGKFVTWNGVNITDMMGNVIP